MLTGESIPVMKSSLPYNSKEIYSETEGIPGRIIARLSDYDNNPKYNSSQLTLVAAVIGLIALALITQWLSAVQFRA